MNIKFPYQIDARGRTAGAGQEEHIREMIRQVLFTTPGERVNRPDFGSGLLQLVFSPNSAELAATVQFLAKGALQQWLGEVIEVGDVTVEVQESTLTVQVQYSMLNAQTIQTATFNRTI
jgi:uncharacterized protein